MNEASGAISCPIHESANTDAKAVTSPSGEVGVSPEVAAPSSPQASPGVLGVNTGAPFAVVTAVSLRLDVRVGVLGAVAAAALAVLAVPEELRDPAGDQAEVVVPVITTAAVGQGTAHPVLTSIEEPHHADPARTPTRRLTSPAATCCSVPACWTPGGCWSAAATATRPLRPRSAGLAAFTDETVDVEIHVRPERVVTLDPQRRIAPVAVLDYWTDGDDVEIKWGGAPSTGGRRVGRIEEADRVLAELDAAVEAFRDDFPVDDEPGSHGAAAR